MSRKKIYVDIDDTICFYKKGVKAGGSSYPNAKPSYENISKINKLYSLKKKTHNNLDWKF